MTLSSRDVILLRQQSFDKARKFFRDRSVAEVDPLLLSQAASIDAHIDLFSTTPSPAWQRRFLFSSPEYAMKRLLSKGSGDIFYLGHVFRNEPQGRFHSPEFLMAEWYRIGFSFRQIIEETADFARLFVGNVPMTILTYREAFQTVCGFDPLLISMSEAIKEAKKISSLTHLPLESYSLDDILSLILSEKIEPTFDPDQLTALIDYPASQAALSETETYPDGTVVGQRFELYFNRLELANGYCELKDAKEQRRRLLEQQEHRRLLGKELLPIDLYFLHALEKGLPPCCGVAVGVDRLILLEANAPTLASILPIAWNES